MSIGGRNHHRGSTVNIYRATQGEAAGGLTRRTWILTHEARRLALYSIADATARRLFGEEDEIEAVVVAPTALGIRRGDAFVVTKGQFDGRRFVVTAERPMLRFTELALTATAELIDPQLPGVDPDRVPVEAT